MIEQDVFRMYVKFFEFKFPPSEIFGWLDGYGSFFNAFFPKPMELTMGHEVNHFTLTSSKSISKFEVTATMTFLARKLHSIYWLSSYFCLLSTRTTNIAKYFGFDFGDAMSSYSLWFFICRGCMSYLRVYCTSYRTNTPIWQISKMQSNRTVHGVFDTFDFDFRMLFI